MLDNVVLRHITKPMSDAEFIRKKYLYRRLIMTKKVKLKRKAATGLVGPDCAYHLYSQMPTKAPETTQNESDDQNSATGGGHES